MLPLPALLFVVVAGVAACCTSRNFFLRRPVMITATRHTCVSPTFPLNLKFPRQFSISYDSPAPVLQKAGPRDLGS